MGNRHLLRGSCALVLLTCPAVPALSLPQISQAIDRVTILQKYYSPDYIRRCRQRPLVVAEKLTPTRFPGALDSTAPALREPRPDIRVVDKDIIEMSSVLDSRLPFISTPADL